VPDGPLSGPVRSTPRFQLAAASTVVLLLGVLGPWQKTLLGISANGLEIAPIVLVPALLLAGYAVYAYDRAREDQRKRIGRLLVGAGLLAGLAVAGNATRIGGLVLAGWGPVVAGVGGAGLITAGIWVPRSESLTGQ
jgi:hypothetical protein